MCFSANALYTLRPIKANGDAMPPAAVAAALAADPDIFRMHGAGFSGTRQRGVDREVHASSQQMAARNAFGG